MKTLADLSKHFDLQDPMITLMGCFKGLDPKGSLRALLHFEGFTTSPLEKIKTFDILGDLNSDPNYKSCFKEWGFNVVRLGVMWPGVEPEPGKVDDGSLSKLGEDQVQ